MAQNTISVNAQDLHAVIRSLQDENTNLKLVNASLTRQYVETQAEHAKCGKEKAVAGDTPNTLQHGEA